MILEYCKTNYRRIGRGEDPVGEPEAVQLLLLIKPIHITRWLNEIAYQKIEPGPSDRPLHARANTLLAHKRNVSYYMPRNGEKWDFHGAQGGRGNPTTAKSRQNKHKICLRKKLVDAVKFLLPHTPATVACERLEEVYAFDGRKASCLRDIGKELKITPRLPRYFARYLLN